MVKKPAGGKLTPMETAPKPEAKKIFSKKDLAEHVRKMGVSSRCRYFLIYALNDILPLFRDLAVLIFTCHKLMPCSAPPDRRPI